MVIDTLAMVDTGASISTLDYEIIPTNLLIIAERPLITHQMDGSELLNTHQVLAVKLQFANTCQEWSKPYHISKIWVKNLNHTSIQLIL